MSENMDMATSPNNDVKMVETLKKQLSEKNLLLNKSERGMKQWADAIIL